MTTDDEGATVLQLVYASAETTPFSDEDLMALLEQSRAANEARGVTGMLLYHEGSFIQALEGDPETVRALYEKITHDGRHHNERLLYEVEPMDPTPFVEEADSVRLVGRLLENGLPKPSELLPELPSAFEELLSRLLAPLDGGRYRTADEVRTAVAQVRTACSLT